jgi:hypothetical protein
VKLNSVLELAGAKVFVGKKHTQRLEEQERSRGIVIDTGSTGSQAAGTIYGVEMCADDDCTVAPAGDSDNDGVLGPQ